jgi:glyoxylase-like metal-dependent hydrolase (beta-lactamase superfamily II)
MIGEVTAIAMEEQLPVGVLGPTPVSLDIRAYLVPHASGLVLVDTGLDHTGSAIHAGLVDAGAAWTDVSHIVITHAHPDHTGALIHARRAAPGASVLASPLEGIEGAEVLADGEVVGLLRAFATPGTPRAT